MTQAVDLKHDSHPPHDGPHDGAGGHDADGHGHDHDHDPNLAHHFDTLDQQFDSAKVGMWVFLATEILMFGGLFVAYAYWRANHPRVFEFGAAELKWELGFTNTFILITSSFTMAWAVRASQLGQRKLCIWLLILTILGGFGFLGVKSFEYKAKYDHYLLVGTYNRFYPEDHRWEGVPDEPAYQVEHHGADHADDLTADHTDDAHAVAVHADAAGKQVAETADASPEHSQQVVAASAPAGLAATFETSERSPWADAEEASAGDHGSHKLGYEDLTPLDKQSIHQFFQIYFLMTGLHTIHVIIGMGVIFVYALLPAIRGRFGPKYFTPVDLSGLYWHLVDLIWIFLFPLLYLIH